jgi:drug/metabolite transporter (DMT)-like permease
MTTNYARLTPATVVLLTVPPLTWALNAVVGRMLRDTISPLTLNFLRWGLALALLLPIAAAVLRASSPMWPHWRRYVMLGLLGIGSYNALQYLALQTSTPLNVTLVGASLPFWMLAVGTLFFKQRVTTAQAGGALLSMVGVLLVLGQGNWQHLLELRLVPGDLYMVVATVCWAFYSWLLVGTQAPAGIRQDWAAFLVAQAFFGVAWSGLFAAGEWGAGAGRVQWSWTLAAALAFIAIGPAIVAFRCWSAGVQRAGPTVAGFFINLTPLFAALLSAVFLEELPRWYHGAAFALIVGGIVLSSMRPAARRADQ